MEYLKYQMHDIKHTKHTPPQLAALYREMSGTVYVLYDSYVTQVAKKRGISYED
jgi:hypothetical protein